jgi:hypothetical protein
MFSFCFRKRCNYQIINDNFKQIAEDIKYFKTELQELREKQQQTKKNLVKVIDTFTLNEYVLFKTRLLTKKQSYDLVDYIYDFYEIPVSYRDSDGFTRFEQIHMSKRSFGSGYSESDVDNSLEKLGILRQVNSLKLILDKLDEPHLKDSEYALKKAEWCSPENKLRLTSDFLDNVIKCIKEII